MNFVSTITATESTFRNTRVDVVQSKMTSKNDFRNEFPLKLEFQRPLTFSVALRNASSLEVVKNTNYIEAS